MEKPSQPISKTNLVFKALAGGVTETQCIKCGVTEWVIPLDGNIDEIFLANYHCDECDAASEPLQDPAPAS